jgi:hypothetical protein
MANELENAIKSAASAVAQYVKDAAILTVETKFIEVGKDKFGEFEQALPMARTIIRLDGDCETIAPLRKTETGSMEVDTGLLELHQLNVNTAIEYRAKILNSLLGTIVRR